jgi:hypothetical protein
MAFYASENHPGLRGVMDAIKTSIAASRYREAWGTNDRDATPREFFARAFAQFIAEESNDAVLGELLQKWRFGAYESAGWPRDFQWHRPDFKPIKQEMRLLFARNGWKGGGR